MPTQQLDKAVWPSELVCIMHDEYMQGKSLRTLGAEHGVSHERIRQLFERHDLPTKRPRRKKERSKAWNARNQIWALYRKHGTVEAVDTRLKNFSHSDIASVIEDMPLRQIYRRKGETSWERPVAEIKAALKEAAKLCGEPLTIPAYRKVAPKHGWPADLTVVRVYDSWFAACKAAGVKANPPEGPRRGSITFEDCIAALQECATELGETPSYEVYTKWAREKKRPSGPTVRVKVRQHQGNGNHNRGSWSAALTIAFDT